MAGTGRKYKMLISWKGWQKGRVYGPDSAGPSLVGWNRAVFVEDEPAPEPKPEPVAEVSVIETAAVEPETEKAAFLVRPVKKGKWGQSKK